MIGHAVVVGGGIGGLLIAHALASRCQRVTVVERAHYPEQASSTTPQARRGVPQSHCLHMLMAAGMAAFDDLTPGWRQSLLAHGAVPFDASADTAMRFPAGWLPQTQSGIHLYACSRPLLEDVLLNGLAAYLNVRVQQGQQVLGLLTDKAGEQITGVSATESQGANIVSIPADLVVDASGTASRLRQWLLRLSDTVSLNIAETVIESDWQYVSRWFYLKPEAAPNWQCLSIAPSTGVTSYAAMMLRAENDYWNVVLLARKDRPVPRSDLEFLNFTLSLGESKLFEVLKLAEPVSPIHYYGRMANRMRHFDRLANWPNGLVAIGDSVCTLDPYFGLGMTAAARGAVLLSAHLDRHGSAPVNGIRFQKELAHLNDQPWQLATGHDRDGKPLMSDRAHIRRLYEAAPSCPKVAQALIAVRHLLRPEASLREIPAI